MFIDSPNLLTHLRSVGAKCADNAMKHFAPKGAKDNLALGGSINMSLPWSENRYTSVLLCVAAVT
jgi:5-enolpyruvylshikimate-3-phosphate synthase